MKSGCVRGLETRRVKDALPPRLPKVKEALKDANMTYRDLAERLFELGIIVTANELAQAFNGVRWLSAACENRICDVLGIDRGDGPGLLGFIVWDPEFSDEENGVSKKDREELGRREAEASRESMPEAQ